MLIKQKHFSHANLTKGEAIPSEPIKPYKRLVQKGAREHAILIKQKHFKPCQIDQKWDTHL